MDDIMAHMEGKYDRLWFILRIVLILLFAVVATCFFCCEHVAESQNDSKGGNVLPD